jgi:hypothetical protein
MMRIQIPKLCALIAASSASPAFAVPETVNINSQIADSNPTIIQDRATELAQFLYSREDMARQLKQTLSTSLPQSMKNVSDFGIYETEYPGLIAAVVDAAIPEMLKAYDDKMPLLWRSTSQIYREKFNSAELDQILAFYKSPVGIRFMKTLQNNVDSQQFMDAAVASQGEETDSVSDAVKKAKTQALKKTGTQTSAADKIAIFRFENSPLGPKLAAVGPLISKAVSEWDYYFPEEQKQAFLASRQTIITEFIAKADSQKQSLDSAAIVEVPPIP